MRGLDRAKIGGSTPLHTLRNQKGIGQISGTSFLKTYGIAYSDQTRSYPAVWNSEQGMLIVNLG